VVLLRQTTNWCFQRKKKFRKMKESNKTGQLKAAWPAVRKPGWSPNEVSFDLW
jgi:hypothetical protein